MNGANNLNTPQATLSLRMGSLLCQWPVSTAEGYASSVSGGLANSRQGCTAALMVTAATSGQYRIVGGGGYEQRKRPNRFRSLTISPLIPAFSPLEKERPVDSISDRYLGYVSHVNGGSGYTASGAYSGILGGKGQSTAAENSTIRSHPRGSIPDVSDHIKKLRFPICCIGPRLIVDGTWRHRRKRHHLGVLAVCRELLTQPRCRPLSAPTAARQITLSRVGEIIDAKATGPNECLVRRASWCSPSCYFCHCFRMT